MKVVIQRVSEASVLIDNSINREIKQGFVILLGITNTDDEIDIQWLVKKIIGLRVFNDDNQIMNRSILDINGSILLISQFTLYASTKKGNRPSYIQAAKPEFAKPLYNKFIDELRVSIKKLELGEFGADMKVSLVNDGPVTIIIDSKNKE